MTTWAVVNMLASAMIIVLTMANWRSFYRLNAFQQVGISALSSFCACIVMKAGYNLSMSEFNSDVFGILCRCAWVVYLVGVTIKNTERCQDPWTQERRAYSRDSVFSS